MTQWSRKEGFTPGAGDVDIYRHTDRQGLWVGWLGSIPIGCIAGVRYNAEYGFIGLFLVVEEHRGKGYGLQLWKHALHHLANLPCIGLEAAPDRVDDYSRWGFCSSSFTTRWQRIGDGSLSSQGHPDIDLSQLSVFEGAQIPSKAVHIYDAKREPSPRPHFLSDWLKHPAGKVIALVDKEGFCHGFGRIRPCFLEQGEGWRIGPLLADTPSLAELLLYRLIKEHSGIVLLDTPGLNMHVNSLLKKLGFKPVSKTLRMYRGDQPPTSMSEVYALACLELG